MHAAICFVLYSEQIFRQTTDNACLFFMAKERTRRSSSQLTMVSHYAHSAVTAAIHKAQTQL